MIACNLLQLYQLTVYRKMYDVGYALNPQSGINKEFACKMHPIFYITANAHCDGYSSDNCVA